MDLFWRPFACVGAVSDTAKSITGVAGPANLVEAQQLEGIGDTERTEAVDRSTAPTGILSLSVM